MKKFLSGSFTIIFWELLTKALSFVYLIYLSQVNPSLNGFNATLLVPFGFAITLCTLGIIIVMQMDISNYYSTNSDRVKTSVINTTVFLIFAAILMNIFVLLFPDKITSFFATSGEYQNYYEAFKNNYQILSLGIIIYVIGSLMKTIMISKGIYLPYAFSMFFEQILKLAIIIICIEYLEQSNSLNPTIMLYLITISTIISMLISNLYLTYHFVKGKHYNVYIEGKYLFELKYIKILFSTGIIYWISSFYMATFDTFDAYTINRFASYINNVDQIRTEYLGESLKLVITPIQISSAFISVMIKELGGKTKDGRQNIFSDVLEFTLIYCIIMLSLFFILSEDLYNLMFTTTSTGIITIHSLIIPFYIIRNIISAYYVTSSGKVKHIFISSVIAISTKIILNIILVKLIGINGLIFSSLISLFSSILYLFLMNQKMFSNIKLKSKLNLSLKALLLIFIVKPIYIILSTYFKYNFIKLIIGFILILLVFILLYKNFIQKIFKNLKS